MRNIERLARCIIKNGSKNILVHTIHGTKNWLIAEKFEPDKWLLTMCNPMGVVTFNLGVVSDREHLGLWAELVKMEIEQKASQMLQARELKNKINQFLKKYAKTNKNKKYKRIK